MPSTRESLVHAAVAARMSIGCGETVLERVGAKRELKPLLRAASSARYRAGQSV